MPLGAEWGLVAVTEDLKTESRALSQLAWEFRQEGRAWTHPNAREALEVISRALTDQAQLAALESTRGDYWTRLDAAQRATEQRRAGQATLRLWWQRGELWNDHRMRPVPASIRGTVEGMTPHD